jgi:FKBP-type peptidyl-prolyl cis-trans isomerase
MRCNSFNKMTIWYRSVCILFALTSCSQGNEDKKQQEEVSEDIRPLSETMGHFIVENLRMQDFKLDMRSLVKGIEDAEAGQVPPLTKQQFIELLTKYKNNIEKIKSTENLKLAEDFLAENKSDSNVIVLQEGKLQYIILEKGNGDNVKEDGNPLVNYEGKLIDGTIFDSTKMRGKPVQLPLKSTIPGFKTGVTGMKEGEKRRIFIHPELAYGTQGGLPPNSLLIFEVEVLKAEGEEPDNP